MTRMVYCRKFQQELEGLDTPPMPGAIGQAIFEQVSKRAWQEWQQLQTMLINEKHLNLRDAAARSYLAAQRESFFDNQPVDSATGYVAPAPKS